MGFLGGIGAALGAGLIGNLFNDGQATKDANFNRDWSAAFNQLNYKGQQAQLPFLQDYYKQAQGLTPEVFQQVQQQMGGMPPELMEQLWQYGKRGIAEGYGKAGTGLGEALAGQGTMRGGVAPQAWLDKIGLPQAQAMGDLGLQQVLQNFQQRNLGVSNAMGLLGGTPSPGAGSPNTINVQQQQPVDWGALGSLFAKGIGGFGGQQPGTTPGLPQPNPAGVMNGPGSILGQYQPLASGFTGGF